MPKAPDLPSMTTMALLVRDTLHMEMDLYRSYVAKFGLTADDLEHETKASTCQGYTDFLLRMATTGSFAQVLAALLPCNWGYAEV